jgi:hypothetical protein
VLLVLLLMLLGAGWVLCRCRGAAAAAAAAARLGAVGLTRASLQAGQLAPLHTVLLLLRRALHPS